MNGNASRFNRCCFLISVLLLLSVPVLPQYKDGLGGNWNNPAMKPLCSTPGLGSLVIRKQSKGPMLKA